MEERSRFVQWLDAVIIEWGDANDKVGTGDVETLNR